MNDKERIVQLSEEIASITAHLRELVLERGELVAKTGYHGFPAPNVDKFKDTVRITDRHGVTCTFKTLSVAYQFYGGSATKVMNWRDAPGVFRRLNLKVEKL